MHVLYSGSVDRQRTRTTILSETEILSTRLVGMSRTPQGGRARLAALLLLPGIVIWTWSAWSREWASRGHRTVVGHVVGTATSSAQYIRYYGQEQVSANPAGYDIQPHVLGTGRQVEISLRHDGVSANIN